MKRVKIYLCASEDTSEIITNIIAAATGVEPPKTECSAESQTKRMGIKGHTQPNQSEKL
jgi:hypothetical protein